MPMNENNKKALIVAYFLSRFDANAYAALGFATYNATHAYIGKQLGVNPNTVKNMRDDFDPHHSNKRAGWYQRPPRPSRRSVLESFCHLDFASLNQMVTDLLANPAAALPIVAVIVDDEVAAVAEEPAPPYKPIVPRFDAAEVFREFHHMYRLPYDGALLDCRDRQIGYTYALASASDLHAIIVKPVSEDAPFTLNNLEWSAANRIGPRCHLALIGQKDQNTSISIVTDPATVITPRAEFRPIVEACWHVEPTPLLNAAMQFEIKGQ